MLAFGWRSGLPLRFRPSFSPAALAPEVPHQVQARATQNYTGRWREVRLRGDVNSIIMPRKYTLGDTLKSVKGAGCRLIGDAGHSLPALPHSRLSAQKGTHRDGTVSFNFETLKLRNLL
jgi:hypothetical protein